MCIVGVRGMSQCCQTSCVVALGAPRQRVAVLAGSHYVPHVKADGGHHPMMASQFLPDRHTFSGQSQIHILDLSLCW